MNIDLAKNSTARIDELVRYVRRGNHDLAGGNFDRLIADCEGSLPFLHDKDFPIRVAVEPRALSRPRFDEND
jgi:hypothetical protein